MLSEVVYQFESVYQKGEVPRLQDFVPEGAADRPALIAELVRVDLEYRRKRGLPIRVDDYLTPCPELTQDEALLLEVIEAECHSRRERGEPAPGLAYAARFPALAERLSSGLFAATVDCTLITPGPNAPWTGLPQVPGYEVLGVLGEGGMGVVYRARHLALNRIVALKMIKGGAHVSRDELQRFRSEAQAVAQLQHPNVVQIHEVGESGGLPFFTLEYCAGGSLARKLAGTPLPARTAAVLVETLARAVAAAHQKQIVHRDLKPHNVLLAEDGTPKVTDFGLAKKLDTGAHQTQSGAIVGTPSYMAPEQARGDLKAVGPAADVYALGALLYECLTGRPPFRAVTALDTVLQVLNDEPVAVRRVQPKAPRDLETICMKCLHKEPARRYGSAAGLADDLHRFLNFEPIQARPVGIGERALKWVRRRPAATLGVLLVLLVALSAGVGYRLWQQKEEHRSQLEQERRREEAAAAADRPQTAYYANYVMRNGLPVGVGAVTEQDARHRQLTYRFTVQRGQLKQVEIVNGRGQPTWERFSNALMERQAPATGPRWECAYRFSRDNQDRPVETAYDPLGRVFITLRHDSATTAQYLARNGATIFHPITGIARQEFVLTVEGFYREIRYLDPAGKPRPTREGIYGMRVEPDARGQPQRLTYLGPQGQPAPNPEGIASMVCRHDNLGNLEEQTYFDLAGKPLLSRSGIHRVKYRYDDHGNLVEVACYGLTGQPVMSTYGYHKVLTRHDVYGNVIERSWLGADGRLVTGGGLIARLTARYDERGHVIAVAYFDAAGRPLPDADGVASWTAAHDERHCEIRRDWFGVDGKPRTLPLGYARVVRQFDERGHRTEEAYFDGAGKPAAQNKSSHRWTARHDEDGRLTRIAFFDAGGKPCASPVGIAGWTIRYEYGREVERAWFGVDGKPAAIPEGYARVVSTHNPQGAVVEQAYFGVNGKPTLHRDGYARWKMLELPWEGITMQVQVFFGLDGQSTTHRDGYGALIASRDSRGNVTEVRYLSPTYVTKDTSGQPRLNLVLSRDGYAIKKAVYDQQNHCLEETYFGIDEKPVHQRAGYTRITRTFDQNGRQTGQLFWALDQNNEYIRSEDRQQGKSGLREQLFFTAEGHPAVHRDGYHRRVMRCDSSGQPLEEWYLGTDGKPVLHRDGYQRVVSRYKGGHATEVAYFGLDGKPAADRNGVARWTAGYDPQGRQIESAFFGVDGKPALRPEGYHRWTIDHDARGNQTRVAYFGLNGRPVRTKEGFARLQRNFDRWNHCIEEAWFDSDDRPVLLSAGHARLTFQYDKEGNYLSESRWILDGKRAYVLERKLDPQGRILERAHFTAAGKPSLDEHGTHRWTARYDARGHRTEEAYFGLDDRPAPRRLDDVARLTMRHDAGGHCIEMAFFGVDGKPTLHRPDGHHGWTARYENGREVERAFFGPDRKPVLVRYGYARYSTRYDAQGRRIGQDYFGIDGKPIQASEGFAAWRDRYDIRGRLVESSYFGVDGKLTIRNHGFARWVARHDDQGRETERAYFGVDGKPAINRDGGFARVVNHYDSRGRWTGQEYFGTDGKPMRNDEGIARWTAKFHTRGYEAERAYFDTEGKPALHARERCAKIARAGFYTADGKKGLYPGKSYHLSVARYDTRGLCLETAYFGVDGKPVRAQDGVHRWTARYDERGHRTEEAYFGLDSRPAPRTLGGMARVTMQRDADGHCTEMAYFGVDGKPALHRPDGNHGWTARYENGREVERTYFGLERQPVTIRAGYARTTRRYDTRGNVLEEAYFGSDGKPVQLVAGFHRWQANYDDKGRKLEVAFFGTAGKPALHQNGYTRMTYNYAAAAEALDVTAFDLAGKPVRLEVVIAKVLPGGQAATVGLRKGDILQTYDGRNVRNSAEFIHGRQREAAGNGTRTLRVLRQGKSLDVELRPGPLGASLGNRALSGTKPVPERR